MSFSTLTGLSGLSLLLSVITLRFLLFLRVKKQTAVIIALLFFVISFFPVSGYSINQYLRGLLNDLSISSLLLMTHYMISIDSNASQTRPILKLIAVTGLFFYPMALGFGAIDPYSWGYLNHAHDTIVPLIFISLLALLVFFSFYKKWTLLLFCIAFSILAYQLQLLESKNLWDYLLDPVIFFYALISVLIRSLRTTKLISP